MARSWYENAVRYFQGDDKDKEKPTKEKPEDVKSDGTTHKPTKPAVTRKQRRQRMEEILKRDGG